MPGLMEGNRTLLGRRYDLALPFKTAYDPVYCIQEILSVYEFLVVAGSYQGSLVADICNVSAGEARSLLCKETRIKCRIQLEFLEVDVENCLAVLEFRKVYGNLAVKPAGPHQSLVKYVRTVGSGKDYHSAVCPEAVHLGKELVECIFSFIV